MKQRWTRPPSPASHSSLNDEGALALQAWLIREGWSGEDDIFLEASAAANRPIGIGGITTIQLAV